MERDSLDADLDRWQDEQDEDRNDMEIDRLEWIADNCDFFED
jgi:hypothetical protein